VTAAVSSPFSVEEVLHGVTVSDPFRWLEDRGSPRTEEWIWSQKTLLDSYFSTLQGLEGLRRCVSEFLDLDVIDQVAEIGDRCFYRRRAKNQEQACIWVKDRATKDERVLVDPNYHGQYISARIRAISEDRSLLAYELRRGGEDRVAIHIVDVASGHTLPEHLDTGFCRGFVFRTDNTGFYFYHEPADATSDHTIRLRTFTLGAEEGLVVFRQPRTQRSRLVLMSDDQYLGAAYVHDHGPDVAVDFYRADRGQDTNWQCVFANRPIGCAPFLIDGRILMLTEEEAPNGRIVELCEDGSVSRAIVPESESRIEQVAIVGQIVYAAYLIGGNTVVRTYSLSGQCLGAAKLRRKGSVTFLPSYGRQGDRLFYSYQSFTEPPTIYSFRPETERSERWWKSTKPARHAGYRIFRRTYVSHDGTEIPITLVMGKGVKPHDERPAILTSYGGFGISMTPQFSALVSILLEMGAVFAVPNIRGGSEFSAGWHEAARRRNRQVAIDDFISAAECLCSQGITSPDKLAIFGGSNSGLLVGAALTQRPDLFRAVLCIAPLLDMVRYERFGHARKWETEYGTVKDAEDFRALYAYSPYHHLDSDRNYPSVLFVSGDKDDRCDPMHVRKMAARLQDGAAQRNPILVDYSPERGHCPVLPLSVRIEALMRRVAFLCHELNIPLPVGEAQ